MVFAVQGLVGFRNTARRDTVMGTVETRLAQNVPFGTTTVAQATIRQSTSPAMYVEVRFSTRGEADSFWTDLQAALGSGINGPTTGSRLWRHDCVDDAAGSGPCAIAQEVAF